MGSSALLGNDNFSARGRLRLKGAAPPSVNLGPPHISETVRARKFKFYIHLHRVKYSLQVWKFLPICSLWGTQRLLV